MKRKISKKNIKLLIEGYEANAKEDLEIARECEVFWTLSRRNLEDGKES